jgi:xylulokinase
VILTVDLGTSVTKVMVWGEDGPLATGRAELETSFGEHGRVEQDATTWWVSVVHACAAVRAGEAGPELFDAVDVVSLTGARQSFVPVTATGKPVGPGLVWSDRRAGTEAQALADALGGADQVRQATGMVLDGSAMAAKIAWLARHEPDRLAGARWLLSPRDLVVWRMTGTVVTDPTLASASGLYDASGEVVPALAGPAVGLLAEVVAPTTVVGALVPDAAGALGLRPGTSVVVGAGDRACEVLGTGASAGRPMVSWGTTANVSVPCARRPDALVAGVVVTAGAFDGWVVEGGLSAAGSFLAWLAALSGTDVDRLVDAARSSPPGARGVVATPWLGGARAPWWRDRARAAFVGLGFEHDAGDLARAAVEAVAYDAARCLAAVTAGPEAATVDGLAASGDVRSVGLWLDVLAGVTALPVRRRRFGEAASTGAVLVAARATGTAWELDRIDPIVAELEPSPALVRRYRELRPMAERVASAVVDLGDGPAT